MMFVAVLAGVVATGIADVIAISISASKDQTRNIRPQAEAIVIAVVTAAEKEKRVI